MAELQRITTAAGLVGYRSPLLADVGVPHFFTTRKDAAGAELDAGCLDDVQARHVLAAAGCAAHTPIIQLKQVHGSEVLDEDHAGSQGERCADGLLGSRPGRLLLIKTADCVPVLIASRDGQRVAAVHAGWRGLVSGVIPAALALLEAGDALAAIGPCLSRERFEVGEEVAAAFVEQGLGATVDRASNSRPHIDLREAARIQLEACGLREIDVSTLCTWSEVDELYSYRRDVTHGGMRSTGRLGAFIGAR